MSNTGRLEQNDVLRQRIADRKAQIRTELASYAQAAKNLKDGARKKLDAERRYERRQTDKNAASAEEAASSYDDLYKLTAESLSRLNSQMDGLFADWDQLIWQISILDAKAAPRESGELDRYKRTTLGEKKRTDDLLAEAGITVTLAAAKPKDTPTAVGSTSSTPAASDPASEAAPRAAASDTYVEAEVRTVKTSDPIRIDISSHVERAIGIAMDKLAVSLDKRIEAYFASYVPNIPVTGGAAAGSEIVALTGKVADDEKALLEKLTGIVEILKKLNTDMASISAAYNLMDAKNREIIELQKESNDMQRHTLREQQGVQVNQRVVNTDQLKITEAQVAMISAQKKAAEEQARLLSRQTTVSETQRAVLDTQASLEEAMKAVIAEQKKIIAEQQQIIAENERQLAQAASVAASQAEVAASQKELSSTQRQIARDQRAVADKQRETVDVQRTLTDDVRDVLKDARGTKVKKPVKPEN